MPAKAYVLPKCVWIICIFWYICSDLVVLPAKKCDDWLCRRGRAGPTRSSQGRKRQNTVVVFNSRIKFLNQDIHFQGTNFLYWRIIYFIYLSIYVSIIYVSISLSIVFWISDIQHWKPRTQKSAKFTVTYGMEEEECMAYYHQTLKKLRSIPWMQSGPREITVFRTKVRRVLSSVGLVQCLKCGMVIETGRREPEHRGMFFPLLPQQDASRYGSWSGWGREVVEYT